MSYYFNLPIITDLTIDQQRAVSEAAPLSLAGGPGTGKSVVCLWRHIRNYAVGTRQSVLLTYTKTLEHYLRQSAAANNQLASENISRVFWWLAHEATAYDEIIIDEGQDIKQPKFQRYFNYTSRITYGADHRQVLFLNEEEERDLFTWLEEDNRFSGNVDVTLQKNFRNSREILLFTRSVMPDFHLPQKTIDQSRESGRKPIIKINVGFNADLHVQEILKIVKTFGAPTHNIGILVPFQKMVTTYYDAIRSASPNDIIVTKYQAEMENFNGLSGIHITTFKSSKGTEFDTVIIPEFERITWALANAPNITESDYYVAFTRAKINLILLCKFGNPGRGDLTTYTIEN